MYMFAFSFIQVISYVFIGLHAIYINLSSLYLCLCSAVTPHVTETIIKTLNLQLSQNTRANQVVKA
jgi:hypothetical protein